MFDAAKKLREAGVLGLNERNAEYIMRLNPRRFYPRVDDKALTSWNAMMVQSIMCVLREDLLVRQGDTCSLG